MKALAGSIFIILFMILQIALAGAIIWVVFWIINGVMWLSGIGGEALITELVLSELNPWGRALVYILEFEWLYAIAYFAILHEVFKGDDSADAIDIIVCLLLTTLVIFVYDPRIAPHMPDFIEGPIQWLQTTCNARLVGGVSMKAIDFSGSITDPVYYNLFDFLIGGSAIFYLISKGWIKNN